MAESFSREKYDWVMELLEKRQDLLRGKQDALAELYSFCDTHMQQELVKNLLIRFNLLDDDTYGETLLIIAQDIISKGYTSKDTVLITLAKWDDSDSSQEVLNRFKVTMAAVSGERFRTNNKFNNFEKLYNLGYRHFVAVDEFCGSGKTIKSRFDEFIKAMAACPEATIDFFVVAGMKEAQNMLIANGISAFIGFAMDKGISGQYPKAEISARILDMTNLENKLSSKSGNDRLKNCRLGYGRSEAIYLWKGHNIANNVFPVFWWEKTSGNRRRNRLFVRV